MHEDVGILPEWFRKGSINVNAVIKMGRIAKKLNIHTICESAHCPNRYECFARNTATFLILGDICTRSCNFCSVKKGHPSAPDPAEPDHIVEAVKMLGLRHVVVTSVTRDDLSDGGASHFATVIAAIRSYDPQITIETLIPDFDGSYRALKKVVDSDITVLNHNIETVPRLYDNIRRGADYKRSIDVLTSAKEISSQLRTKSGLMLGLGETEDEVLSVMEDLLEAKCSILTLGQYLRPSKANQEIDRFVHPKEFEYLAKCGTKMGFEHVFSGPCVRSSYQASTVFNAL